MVVYFLPSFVLQIVSVSCCLYLTLEIRPTFKRILSHMIIVIIPVIYLYSNWSSQVAVVYLIISLMVFFFINKKDSRAFLDVSILTIDSLVALNLAVLFLFSFFIKLVSLNLSVSSFVCLLFFF